MRRIFFFLILLLSVSDLLLAQKTTCPCQNCPDQIMDGVEGFPGIFDGTDESTQNFTINIFNVLNNQLSNNGQCIKKVWIKFKHDFVGDIEMFLISPDGQEIQLIGPISEANFFSTSNTTFDVSFVRSADIADPEDNLEKIWHNEQDWAVFGTRKGSYFPHFGKLEDFNQGRVNGTWTLRIHDAIPEGNDIGELLDFAIEFCEPAGLVCDPCEEEKAQGIPCIFQVEGSKEQITPIESVCVDVLAQNVAFVKAMEWSMTWDPEVINNAFVQNINDNIPEFSNSDFQINNATGRIDLNYQLPDTDSLGAVVADSSLLFQVCVSGSGEEGDSTLFSFSDLRVIDIEDASLMPEGDDGSVLLTVDLTADCATASQLCGKEDIRVESTKGPGFVKDEGDVACWGSDAEVQSKWYRFDVLESGTFEFLVQPLEAAGFRYFLHKEDCSGAVLSCFSGRQGDDSPIGISNDPMTSFNVNGKFGESLPVEQGETYFLVIDNQDNNNAGFNLQFAGTAVIGDQTLNAVIAEPSILNCVENTLTLNTAGTSTGDQYEYTWELDGGNFLDTSNLLSPVLDAAGEYTLMVEDTRSKCRTSTFVRVNDDSELPLAEAGDRFTLSCTTPQFELSGAGSSIGNIFTYEWSTIDGGNFVGSNTAIISIIDRPGTYILAVTDTTNQCTETDTVIISESMDIPDLLVDSSTISCTNPTVELIATSTTDDVSYSWLGEDLSAPFMGSNFTTGVPGIYTVTVTAPNGCTKTADALIEDDRIFPTTLAGDDFTLTCTTPIFQLESDSSSQGSNFSYEWRTQNGHFVEGTTLTNLTPQVDSAGTYILEITNESNGCVAEDTVTIQKAFELPTVSLNSPTLLTCFDETITIDASPSDSGAIYDFNWIANEGGSFQSGTTTYHPVLNRGGLYVFTLNNLETGCTNQDSVRILESQDKPNLVTTEGIVTCTSPSVALSARSDTSGVTFEWTSTLLDTNRSGDSLIINLPGEYQVTALAPNGCRTQKTLVVADDRLSPTLTVSDNDTLTCSITGLDLEANSSTPNTTFAWIPPNGDSIAGNQILATESGSYLQIATAPNGCTTQDTVQIFNDENAPVAKIELPNPLTCNADFILLDAGLNSSSGPQFRYTWTTVEGQFKNPVAINNTQVEVQTEGIYEFSVHDISNDCETKTSIEVSDIREFPTILLNKPDIDTLSCLDTTLQYTVNTNASIPIYEWTLQGIQLSDTDEFNITQPGEYGLKITDQENNCPSKKEILIRIDTIAPIADAGTPQTLNCAVGSVSLDGTNSSQGDQFTYLWTNETGATIGTDLVTEIDKAGLYNLRVINTRSGCRTQEEVLISAALDNPIAAAGPDTILCSGSENQFTIGSTTTSQGVNFDYEWSTLTGAVLGDNRNLTVDAQGVFILKVINNDNQCEAIDTIEVIERPRPTITVEETGGINCRENLIIYIAKSDMPETTIRWEGQEVFEDTIFRATDALLGASYLAYGINEETGCDNFSSNIIITEDRSPPIVNPGSNTVLNCSDTLFLDGSLSQQDEQFTYTWSTENGNILGATDSLITMVNEPGTYQLQIFNSKNFCSNQDTVVVTDNRIKPNIQLPATANLTCKVEELDLGNDTFPTGSSLFYTWQFSGEIISDQPILPNVTQAGTYILEVIDSLNFCTTVDSVEVLEDKTIPQISLEDSSELDCQNPTTTLSASVDIEGSYQWTTFNGNIISEATTLSPVINAGGSYLLQVENEANGCQTIDSIQVIDNLDRPEIDAGNNTFITCFNDSLVTLNGSLQSTETNLLYEWTAAENPTTILSDSLRVTVAEPGIYLLTAINPTTACLQIDSVEVGSDLQPIAFEMPSDYPDIDCAVPELEIGLPDLMIGDTNSVRYSWTTDRGAILGPTNLPTITVSKAGTYTLEVINVLNGCVSTTQAEIEARGGLPTVEIGLDQFLTCANPSIELGSTATSSGPDFSYQWSRADGSIISENNSPFLSVSEADTYTLLVRNIDSQCEESATVLISEKLEITDVTFPTGGAISCEDTELVLAVQNNSNDTLTYQWTAVEGNIISVSNEQEIMVNQPGSYQIKIREPFSECEVERTILVADNQQAPTFDLGEDRLIRCDEPSVTLSPAILVEGAYTYIWTDEMDNTIARTSSISVDQAGVYQVIVTNEENGCEGQDQITIEANTNQPQGAILSITAPSCEVSQNATVLVEEIVGGSTPYDIQLNTQPIADNIFDNLPAGEYELTVIDALACSWDTTFIIEAPVALDIQILSSSTQLETGDRIDLSIGGTIDPTTIALVDWQPSSLFPCADCPEQTVNLLNDAQVELTIMDENGCEGFAQQFIEVQLAEMPNAITPNGDGNNDVLRIPAIEANPDQFPDNELLIFNRWGDVIYKSAPYRNDWDGTQNGQSVPEGTYYYVLRLDVSEGVTMKGMVTVLR